MTATHLQNRLLSLGDGKHFFTLVRDTSRRQKQWELHRAEPAKREEGTYYNKRSVPCGVDHWVTISEPLTEADAASRCAQLLLKPVPIDNGNPEAYGLLLAEADRRNLPTNYREDLTRIDKAVLCSPGWTTSEFLWVLRTSGTHIINLADKDSRNAPAMVKAIGQFGDDQLCWYHFAGGHLRLITYDRALQLARGED